jgi:hypothetical protein
MRIRSIEFEMSPHLLVDSKGGWSGWSYPDPMCSHHVRVDCGELQQAPIESEILWNKNDWDVDYGGRPVKLGSTL